MLRKIDLYLIPWLCLLYLASFLDRSSIVSLFPVLKHRLPYPATNTTQGNAKIEGLQEDLHMSDGGFATALSVFFVTYALFEPVSNILLKRLRPSRYFPTIVILWGICETSQGLVHNTGGLIAARLCVSLLPRANARKRGANEVGQQLPGSCGGRHVCRHHLLSVLLVPTRRARRATRGLFFR